MEEIENLVEIFQRNQCDLVLMHTVSAYPANDSDLNLKCIKPLKKFNLPIGYSGHEISTAPSVFAAMLSSSYRACDSDRAMYGSDQSASLELAWNAITMFHYKKNKKLLRDGEKRILEEEHLISKKLRYWRNNYDLRI